ncbi:unnamed protein product [Cuscuta epithymum]|uniref:High mobility group B protein 6 n=1 Tax=Cuscuta epithymum TaxID=186058 RepID=A0AAV0CA70_9ASTE|nr:unnamed protein product [Cuscuta epithymum]
MLAQSPVVGNQIQRQKTGRKHLQIRNTQANQIPDEAIKPKLKHDLLDISLYHISNKENVHPLQAAAAGKGKPHGEIGLRDSSLADELSSIREKLERMRIDKQRTEKMLRERAAVMDLQMQELINRGEIQKQLELEVDRLFRLKELRLSCMRISPIRSLRDKEKEKKGKEDQFKDMEEIENEEGSQGRIAPSSPSSDLDTEE